VIHAVAVDPDAARERARSILSGHDYRPERSPQPFTGALRWLGDRAHEILDPVGRFFQRLFRPLFHLIPGTAGAVLGWLVLLGAATLLMWVLVRHRLRTGTAGRTSGGADDAAGAENPTDLERAAAAAGAAGDHGLAIRLRYRAGLLRLGARGAIALQPGATNAVYARTLRSPRFDGLTDTFESVAYGDRVAGPAEDATAVTEWPRVVEDSVRR
jgi:hypothetical protein